MEKTRMKYHLIIKELFRMKLMRTQKPLTILIIYISYLNEYVVNVDPIVKDD